MHHGYSLEIGGGLGMSGSICFSHIPHELGQLYFTFLFLHRDSFFTLLMFSPTHFLQNFLPLFPGTLNFFVLS